MKDIKTAEFFCGTKSFTKVAKKFNYRTYTIDINPIFKPDRICDLSNNEFYNFQNWDDFFYFQLGINFLWCSPPCETFSVASIRHYWEKGKPKNKKCLNGIKILDQTIKKIKDINPDYWFIENPRGMMRKVIDPIFKKYNITDYKRETITYCKYGAKIMKPTDIWTNAFFWKPLPPCKAGSNCHLKASRGSKTGLQGIYSNQLEKARGSTATQRGKIPEKIFIQIFEQFKQSNKKDCKFYL